MDGEKHTLVGHAVVVGERAPDFIAVDRGLSPASFYSLSGCPCLLSSIVSVDTGVCDTQTRHLNQAAAELEEDLRILTISMDLPFALDRWCGAAGVEQMMMLSDHRDAAFGTSYGLLMKDLRLLARAVLVVDRDGIIRHKQIVPEVTDEPDYAAAMAAVRQCM
ncbi:MAG: thiol peroxidase [Candidatus Brocadiia bacterium]